MPAVDIHRQHSTSPTGPARKLRAVTPHDTDELEYVTNGIVCAGGGLISVIAADDAAAVLVPVLAGQIYPIRARTIRATGTTATGIVALIS
ncbi:hypothetical protein [Bosea sp. BH3]|uniref:spike base protein, RCAP_Rcc01079 family n=1 Tax=Bosea sp. BH3 TaxID=2871701 RepID=UPI0021CAF236|nr:hypothetical protein [Bosea sp. BH3]MCU4181127.1 hypothetical protein [Bosea sp. BH3]